MSTAISVRGLSKHFDEVRAVDDLELGTNMLRSAAVSILSS